MHGGDFLILHIVNLINIPGSGSTVSLMIHSDPQTFLTLSVMDMVDGLI